MVAITNAIRNGSHAAPPTSPATCPVSAYTPVPRMSPTMNSSSSPGPITRLSSGCCSTVSGSVMVGLLSVLCEPHCSGHRRHRVEELNNHIRFLRTLPPERRRTLGAVVPEVRGLRLRTGGDEPHRGVRAVGGVAQQWPRQRSEHRQGVSDARRLHPTRVHALDADAIARQSVRPRASAHHLHPFSPR